MLEDEPEEEPEAEREPFRLPALPGRLAAALTGVIVGVFGAMLTYVSLQGCNALRGTETCGGTGLLILVVILVLMVLLGGVLLAAWQISDARSTSFLGRGRARCHRAADAHAAAVLAVDVPRSCRSSARRPTCSRTG